MKRGHRYWALVKRVWDTISIYHAPDIFLTQFNAASIPSRTLFAAHWCQSEVRNGGFHQFFGNSTGVLAPEAIAAYYTLGMPKVASVVETATNWFGTDYPRKREVRDEMLGVYENKHPNAWNPFEQLDDQFFALIDSENGGFTEAADAYAEAHGG